MKFDDIIKLIEENPYSAFFFTPLLYKKSFSYLFIKPVEIISVYKKEDLDFTFRQIQKFIDKGYFGYSLINYEAGFLFEDKLAKLQKNDDKLIQFFFFDKEEVRRFKSSKIIFNNYLKDYSISDFKLSRSENQFVEDIRKIKKYIKQGDTYQVNYTVRGEFSLQGSYASFFQELLFNQSARYSAFINNNKNYIMSLSPELFFNQKDKQILSHPMKGTVRRGNNEKSDRISENELKTSEKNLAENVMIVDLIRNDLGRICKYGSVEVPTLFGIEKYESLYQMVSEVKGKLRKNSTMLDILKNIFPCGSVTGAPKIRTMEIINEIEKRERGIYTGSIGLITPNESKLNIAIRTITIDKESKIGEMGLGSGIVWDSDPKNEYEEVILKSKFLTEPSDNFEIFETMKCENGEIKFLEQHLERMKSACEYFLFMFSKKKIKKKINSKLKDLDNRKTFRFRLSLSKWGDVKTEISNFQRLKKEISVIISQNKIISTDTFRQFKTTNRKLYDDEYALYNTKGFFEVIYLNERNEVAEGSRTNIFFRKGNSWFTPTLESGALPGIFRKHFILKANNLIEKNVKLQDLVDADEIILTNALRGEIKVNKVFISPTEFISFQY